MSKDKETKSASRTPFLLISAILFVVIGLVILVFNGSIFALDLLNTVVKWIVAGALGIVAIVNIVIFARNVKENIKQLIFGALCLIGAVLLVCAEYIGIDNLLMLVIGFLFGLYLIIEGFFKIKSSFASKKNENKAWYVPLILGILSIVFGGVIGFYGYYVSALSDTVRNERIFIIILGLMFVYAGIQNVVNLFFGNKN